MNFEHIQNLITQVIGARAEKYSTSIGLILLSFFALKGLLSLAEWADKRRLEREKLELEILKLRYEIEEIRKGKVPYDPDALLKAAAEAEAGKKEAAVSPAAALASDGRRPVWKWAQKLHGRHPKLAIRLLGTVFGVTGFLAFALILQFFIIIGAQFFHNTALRLSMQDGFEISAITLLPGGLLLGFTQRCWGQWHLLREEKAS